MYKEACGVGGVAASKGAAETQQSFSGRAGACPESEGRPHCPARAGKHTLWTCLMWSNITKKTKICSFSLDLIGLCTRHTLMVASMNIHSCEGRGPTP